MLIKSDNKDLDNKKEYTKVFNYFHDEYTGMLKDFLERHDIEVKEDDCLIDYIIKTRCFMPKYKDYTKSITMVMYNEELSQELKYDLLMNSYEDVKRAFKE